MYDQARYGIIKKMDKNDWEASKIKFSETPIGHKEISY